MSLNNLLVNKNANEVRLLLKIANEIFNTYEKNR